MGPHMHSCDAYADQVASSMFQHNMQKSDTQKSDTQSRSVHSSYTQDNNMEDSQSANAHHIIRSIRVLSDDADAVHNVLLRFPRWRSPAWWASDSGAVTAEFAIVLPAVMLIVLMLLTSARAATIALSCQDAARVTARTLTVEGDHGQAQTVAQSAMRSAVSVSVRKQDASIAVSTQCPVLPSVLSDLPFNVEGYAVALK